MAKMSQNSVNSKNWQSYLKSLILTKFTQNFENGHNRHKIVKIGKIVTYNLNWLNCHKIATTRKINTKSIKMAKMTKNIKKKFLTLISWIFLMFGDVVN